VAVLRVHMAEGHMPCGACRCPPSRVLGPPTHATPTSREACRRPASRQSNEKSYSGHFRPKLTRNAHGRRGSDWQRKLLTGSPQGPECVCVCVCVCVCAWGGGGVGHVVSVQLWHACSSKGAKAPCVWLARVCVWDAGGWRRRRPGSGLQRRRGPVWPLVDQGAHPRMAPGEQR
jgi:hypothetical protein